jgi:4-amino-4-deoxy-L-arabinose transferase-like glycosyltransferase
MANIKAAAGVTPAEKPHRNQATPKLNRMMLDVSFWCHGLRPYCLLGLLSLALYLPGIAALPVLDRDEARFAEATRQMLETGDFLRIRFLGEARNKKPAGIYWLQAASVAVFSDPESNAIWPYRLPSLLGAMAAVLLTFGLGQGLVGRREALIGAGLLAATLELSVEAHIAKTDAVLLATAVAAQGALGLIHRAGRANDVVPWRWPLLFWVAQALAILIKGPVVPVLSLLTIVPLSIADRDLRWLKNLRAWWGLPLMLIIVGPWLVAIQTVTRGAFLSQSIGGDLLGKLIGGEEAHGAPPLTHLLILMAGFWPATFFLGRTIAQAWRGRRETAARFLIAWAVPFWILVELVPTKLPQYLLPVYPALALMAGRALIAADPRWRRYDFIFAAIWALVGLCLMAGLVETPISFGAGLSAIGIEAAVLLTIAGVALLWTRAPAAAICCALVTYIPLAQFVAPRLDRLFPSRAIAALAPPRPVAVAGYSEPSLVFLLGSGTELLPADAAASALAQHRAASAIVAQSQKAAFEQALARLGAVAHAAGTVSGLDYSTGKPVTLTLFKRD